EFPDVFEAFASYVYRWMVARVSDEEIKKGADISKAAGRAPELGDVARLRYTRTGKYAYEDIVRTIGNFKESFGSPGLEVAPVLINALMLRPFATTIGLGIDALTTPSSEKNIPFSWGEGLYVVRCLASPVTSGSGFIRAPSVAWMPVF